MKEINLKIHFADGKKRRMWALWARNSAKSDTHNWGGHRFRLSSASVINYRQCNCHKLSKIEHKGKMWVSPSQGLNSMAPKSS
jgi:hypothetical protein